MSPNKQANRQTNRQAAHILVGFYMKNFPYSIIFLVNSLMEKLTVQPMKVAEMQEKFTEEEEEAKHAYLVELDRGFPVWNGLANETRCV